MPEMDAYQASANGNIEELEEILETGFDINQGDDGDYTLLHWAAQEGQLETVAFLLEQGADPLRKDVNLYTPIDVAVAEGHLELVQFFFDKLEAKSFRELSLLHVAAANGQTACISFMLSRGWEVDQLDPLRGEYTALHWTVQEGEEECVKLLVENGADVNCKTFNGFTPLYKASGEGHAAVADYLIQQGADVNEVCNGVAPLIIASSYNQPQVVEVLLRCKADMEIKDEEGKTALFNAAETGSDEVMLLLLKHGANTDIISRSGKKFIDMIV